MEKSREDILNERKARKAAKLAKKKAPGSISSTKELSQVVDEVDSCFPVCKNLPKIVTPSQVAECISKSDKDLINEINELSIDSKNPEKIKRIPSKDKEPEKSKAQLKAERRAKQESQRALKAAQKKDEKLIDTNKSSIEVSSVKKIRAVKNNENTTKSIDLHKIKLFSHLYRNGSQEETKVSTGSTAPVHKAVIKLGVQYRNKVIIGSNARVIALLNTLKQVISDYETPAEKDFSRGFEMVLVSITTYLETCRPISVSMLNALTHLKSLLSQLPNTITDKEAQIKLRDAIDDYIRNQIDKADKAICIKVQQMISEGDVILTFGYSSLVERILIETNQAGVKFRVIIVDAGPLYEGKELLRRLSKHKLNCVYVLLSATSYIMKEANYVLLGAHALLANGYVMSRAGSSQIALIAKYYNVPVLMCCETHKFSDRAQTDAFVDNELGNPDELLDKTLWKSNNYLTPLTLMYDVTPSELVTAVVTELAVLPCTSVPVVLRVKPSTPGYIQTL